MKYSLLPLALTAALLAGCSGKDSNNQSPATSTNAAAANNGGTPDGYLGALAQAEKSSEKKIDVASLNKAVQQFNVQEGRNPKSLDELVPSYISKIPDAPYGYKIVYDTNTATVSVVQK